MSTERPAAGRTSLLTLLLGFIAPQLVLLLINVRSWTLVAGEAGDQETTAALLIAGAEVLMLAVSVVVVLLYLAGRLSIRWSLALLSLIAHVAYMWWFLLNVNEAIPDTIQPWILTEGNVGRWNFTLMMPGAFISLLSLSRSVFGGMSGRTSMLVAVGGALGTPLVWYLAVTLLQPSLLGQVPVIIGIFVGTVLVVIFLGAVVRIFDDLVQRRFADVSGVQHYTIAALLGIVAPLAGLSLNRAIPFPADFQSVGVYAFTVANGLVLLINAGAPRFATTRLLLRCMTFPFTAYFFLVFLPFMPLSLFAILAVGLGFLMLTPLALGLYQVRVMLMDFRIAAGHGGKARALLVSIAGMMVLPSYFVAEALLDKRAINEALNYFYAHDMEAPALPDSAVRRSASALVELRDRKLDVQLPYLSGMYNAIVFGDMVLSDSRIEHMYGLLTGDALPPEGQRMFGYGRRWSPRWRGGNLVAPQTDVDVEHLEHTIVSPGRSTMHLSLRNNSDETHSMFVERLHLPEGVFVSGLRLKIEDEWVDGRIFDRKTAMWVFQKVTEVRRDPALLVYRSPDVAELRVYPFPPRGTREVEIDIDYHPGVAADLALGGRSVQLNTNVDGWGVMDTAGRRVPAADLARLAYRRSPYLHFILDYSSDSRYDAASFARAMARVGEILDISRCRVSAANITVSDAGEGGSLDIADTAAVSARIDAIALEKMGGLWVEQAIAKALRAASRSTESLRQRPEFVVITHSDDAHLQPPVLDAWSWLAPDMTRWHTYDGSELSTHPVGAASDVSAELIVALKQGSRLAILPAMDTAIFHGDPAEPVQIYDPHADAFQTTEWRAYDNATNASWPKHADLWSRWRRWSLNPAEVEAHRGEMLAMSREQNVLLPVTSFIVVESASQWEILQRKEAQRMGNHSALDFEEAQRTPEPAWWVLLGALLIFLYWRSRNEGSMRRRFMPRQG